MKRLNLDNGGYIEIDHRGIIQFYNDNGTLHRQNGPAVVGENDYQEWWRNGRLHREDGPAIVWANGDQSWYLNGKLHRKDGPAIVWSSGYQQWWLNGKRHRENGPAVVYANGAQTWYLNGKQMSEAEHTQAVAAMKNEADDAASSDCSDHSGRTVVIDGKEYRLTLVDSE